MSQFLIGATCQSMKLSCCFHYRKNWQCRHNLCCSFVSVYNKYTEFHFPEYKKNQNSGSTFLYLLLEVPVGLHKILSFRFFTWLCFQGLANLCLSPPLSLVLVVFFFVFFFLFFLFLQALKESVSPCLQSLKDF